MRRLEELAARADALVSESDALRGELQASLALAAREARPLADALRLAWRYAWIAEFALRLAGRAEKARQRRLRKARSAVAE